MTRSRTSAPTRARTRARHVEPLACQAPSLLPGYPDEQFFGRLGLLRRTASALPGPVGAPLTRFLDHVASTPPGELAADYVATFDHRKRCCLFLTYYAHGDTRKRGMALLRLKHAYAAAGLDLVDEELPDHLCVVLEFAGTGDPAAGRALLLEHRAGVELIRLALHDANSAPAGGGRDETDWRLYSPRAATVASLRDAGFDAVSQKRTNDTFWYEPAAAMPKLRCVLALGTVAHGAVLATLGQRALAFRFAHGAMHAIPDGPTLADSYHCSRYNTNTGRLTEAMFHGVFAGIRKALAE